MRLEYYDEPHCECGCRRQGSILSEKSSGLAYRCSEGDLRKIARKAGVNRARIASRGLWNLYLVAVLADRQTSFSRVLC